MLRNVEKYLKVLPESTCVRLKRDIAILQACLDEEMFRKASELFLKKWNAPADQQVTKFLAYFRAQWVVKNNAWFEGAAPGQPSTNNGIEATNAVIKREHTFRERLPIGHFLHSAIELVEKWSMTRNPDFINCIKYAISRVPALKDYTTAYQWATANHKVIQCDDDEQTYYTSSTASKKDINITWILRMKKKEGAWKTFEEFNEYRNGVWVIHIGDQNLENSSCTCPVFLKQLTCKHVLGMLIRLGLCSNVPEEAKNVPIGQKRKRGRPAKAKKALIVQ